MRIPLLHSRGVSATLVITLGEGKTIPLDTWVWVLSTESVMGSWVAVEVDLFSLNPANPRQIHSVKTYVVRVGVDREEGEWALKALETRLRVALGVPVTIEIIGPRTATENRALWE